jgi:hypothetical protein
MIKKLILIFALLMVTSCGATKGYDGPSLPKEQISQIRFENPDNIEVRRRLVDKESIGKGGVDVLPDVHSFFIESLVFGEPQQCQIYTNFDSSGYNTCLKNNTWCDCYNYMTIYKKCIFPTWNAACGGSLSTQPGKQYNIFMELLADAVRSSVQISGRGKPLPLGTCRVGSMKLKRRDERLGSGMNTAIMNGISSCGY